MFKFKDDRGHIVVEISQNHKFSSRNEINAFINEAIRFRDCVFPKSFVPPLIWTLVGEHEMSLNGRFLIRHLNKNEKNENVYELYQVDRHFDPKTSEHSTTQTLIRSTTKVLNLKEMANLINEELCSISERSLNNE